MESELQEQKRWPSVKVAWFLFGPRPELGGGFEHFNCPTVEGYIHTNGAESTSTRGTNFTSSSYLCQLL